MTKTVIGPFAIIAADDPALTSARDVVISLHDDQKKTIMLTVKSDLLQVIAQQFIAAAQQAQSGPGSAAEASLPVLVEASKAAVVRDPGQGLFFIFEVNDSLSYIFPIGQNLATRLRDELIEALAAPMPQRSVN